MDSFKKLAKKTLGSSFLHQLFSVRFPYYYARPVSLMQYFPSSLPLALTTRCSEMLTVIIKLSHVCDVLPPH